MRRKIVAIALVVVCSHAHGQWIEELGGGIGLQGVRYLLRDTANDRLLICGAFAHANGVQVSPGILEWHNSQFNSLGCGIAWDCIGFINEAGLANPALALAVWNGDVYLGGQIWFTRDGEEFQWLMRWDGTEWHPVPGLDGAVWSLKVIDGELIAAGWFEHAGALVVNGLAKWDGAEWQEVVPVPVWYSGDPPNMIHDVEKYQGDWYVGGQLGPMRNLARWNGAAWEIVGGGFYGGLWRVLRLGVHDDRLYVSGNFGRCEPTGIEINPGSGIVAWDGTQWDDLGGGTCGSYSNTVADFLFWGDTLFAAGNFNRMGGAIGSGLAKWYDNEWCMMIPADHWGTGMPAALAVFHDSLYVAGPYQVAGTDSVGAFGKWVGGGHVEGCGVVDAIQDIRNGPDLIVSPNPASDHVALDCSTRREIIVRDGLGRIVWRGISRGRMMLDVTKWPTGLYTVVHGQGATKLVIAR